MANRCSSRRWNKSCRVRISTNAVFRPDGIKSSYRWTAHPLFDFCAYPKSLAENDTHPKTSERICILIPLTIGLSGRGEDRNAKWEIQVSQENAFAGKDATQYPI